MRAFIAIELPPAIKKELRLLQDQLKPLAAEVKWVKPENIHLTLKFLGEINEEKIGRIKELLVRVTGDKRRFVLALSSVGAFPKVRWPRVIWVGVEDKDNLASKLAAELEEGTDKLGIPREKRGFSAHITIGRVGSTNACKELSEKIEGLKNWPEGKRLEFGVDKLVLFKSTLAPGGAVYEAVKEANFNIA